MNQQRYETLLDAMSRKRVVMDALDRLGRQLTEAQADDLDVTGVFMSPRTLSDIRLEAPGVATLALHDRARIYGVPIFTRVGFPDGEFFLVFAHWPPLQVDGDLHVERLKALLQTRVIKVETAREMLAALET